MREVGLACALLLLAAGAEAQGPGYPQYCCTDAGQFGPYYNGTVSVGQRCSVVTEDGVRRVGTACRGPLEPEPDMLGPMETRGYADHCCTDSGVLGPFANSTWQEGEPCSASDEEGELHQGVACYSASDPLSLEWRPESIFAAVGCGRKASGAPRDGATPASLGFAPRPDSR